MIKQDSILSLIKNYNSYIRGIYYFNDGMVKSLNYSKEDDIFYAKVKGSSGNKYEVHVKLDSSEDIVNYSCTCPINNKYNGACKHVVATVLEINSRWADFDQYFVKERIKDETKKLIKYFENITIKNANASHYNGQSIMSRSLAKIKVRLRFNNSSDYFYDYVTFYIGTKRMYNIKNVKNFIEDILNEREIKFGKEFTYQPGKTYFDSNSNKIIDYLKSLYSAEVQRFNGDFYNLTKFSMFSSGKNLKIYEHNYKEFFDVLKGQTFEIEIAEHGVYNARIVENSKPISIKINKNSENYSVSLENIKNEIFLLDSQGKYIFCEDTVHELSDEKAAYLKPLLDCFSRARNTEFELPKETEKKFIMKVLPALEKVCNIKLDNEIKNNICKFDLKKEIYFDKFNDGICAKLIFKYADYSINPLLEKEENNESSDSKIIIRDFIEENNVIQIFDKYMFDVNDSAGVYVLENEEKVYDFICNGVDELKGISEIFYSDAFKNIGIKRNLGIKTAVRLNTVSGMLEMDIDYDGIEPEDLLDLLSSFKVKKKYYRLKNGSFINLDDTSDKSLEVIGKLKEQFDIKTDSFKKKVIELPKYRALYIENLSKENNDFIKEKNEAFEKMVADITKPQELNFEIPAGMEGILRDYQKIGFRWLKTLDHYGLGGILADDMGLGKTLQVITLILSEIEKERIPSMVIAPTSLVYNWQEEVLKFAPQLKILVLSGNKSERLKNFDAINDYDIIVTSYGTIKRDIELYKDITFRFCFVDEAQHIKNPHTLNAKTVKMIKAKTYFALTGTPIENNLTELWSIFDFIMPGYLLSHTKFSKIFETPIVKNQDGNALKDLANHIKPFVLRRMKKDVLTELPEKIETKVVAEMTKEQKKVYNAYLLSAKKELAKELQHKGFNQSQIKILALLTRLRQICCHPGLFIENYKDTSGKIETLLEIIEDAISGGHRILVFSQFTSMLSYIKKEFEKSGIKHYYLDGATNPQVRLELVKSFNNGEAEVFLISLKAGGTGLNLTGADVVIHYDPWWNPAVEEQATDRVYRIGQEKAVQVYKLITKDSIEERIYELQEKKKELIDSVIKPGENFISKLNEEEVKKLFSLEE